MFQQSRRQVCDLRDVYCLKHSEDMVEKIVSPVIFDTKSFIQTVKCSFFNQGNVHQSFWGTLLSLSYFLLQGKVLCFGSHIGKSSRV